MLGWGQKAVWPLIAWRWQWRQRVLGLVLGIAEMELSYKSPLHCGRSLDPTHASCGKYYPGEGVH